MSPFGERCPRLIGLTTARPVHHIDDPGRGPTGWRAYIDSVRCSSVLGEVAVRGPGAVLPSVASHVRHSREWTLTAGRGAARVVERRVREPARFVVFRPIPAKPVPCRFGHPQMLRWGCYRPRSRSTTAGRTSGGRLCPFAGFSGCLGCGTIGVPVTTPPKAGVLPMSRRRSGRVLAAVAAIAMLATVSAAVVGFGDAQFVGIGWENNPLQANGLEWGAPAPDDVVVSSTR
ncbi:hypothetical protein SAMN05216284_106268 [Micromonospora sediminimaris]|nr:hypothetical protein SAMN05216284_106268 [Micromonospora sediminimaris]